MFNTPITCRPQHPHGVGVARPVILTGGNFKRFCPPPYILNVLAITAADVVAVKGQTKSRPIDAGGGLIMQPQAEKIAGHEVGGTFARRILPFHLRNLGPVCSSEVALTVPLGRSGVGGGSA